MDYVFVGALGGLVGAGELVPRYRDAPWSAVRNLGAATYILVNAAATLAALSMIRVLGLTFGAQPGAPARLTQALVAGFGAVAFFRTSFFVVRIAGRDVGVGPSMLLQVLLTATDRDVDRRRAVVRAQAVTEALRGLSYSQVRDALPAYSLALMQNVSHEEEIELRGKLEDISRSQMEDSLKVNALGLTLMNVVGQRVLVSAAASLRSRIIEGGVLGDVYRVLRESIASAGTHAGHSLEVVGLTLYTAWPQIKTWIESEESPLDGWRITIRGIDVELLASAANKWFDPEWEDEAAQIRDDISSFIVGRSQTLTEKSIDLDYRKYDVVPSFHGFLLSTGTCLLSFLRWDATTSFYSRPHDVYEFIDDDSARSRGYRQLAENWIWRMDWDDRLRAS